MIICGVHEKLIDTSKPWFMKDIDASGRVFD